MLIECPQYFPSIPPLVICIHHVHMYHMCNTETHTLLYMSSNSTEYHPNGFTSHDMICLLQYHLQRGKYKGNIHGSSLHGAYNLNEETSNI